MTKPNFFILGAPKCGTTSLAAWLTGHPQVFMCPIKEPHYFNFDYGIRRTKNLTEYERLFRKARRHHTAIGEASVRYLYSRCAVPGILAYNPDAKFIVLARHPVEMAYSLHGQSLYNGYEDETDFERAWNLQTQRAYGARLPRGCPDPQLLQYGPLCQLGKQLQHLLKLINHQQLLFLTQDEMKNDPQSMYYRVLRFLGLDDDERQHFPIINSSKKRRFPLLFRANYATNSFLARLGIPSIRLGFTAWLNNHAHVAYSRPPLKPAFRDQLNQYFSNDIALIESLTERDLAKWRTEN